MASLFRLVVQDVFTASASALRATCLLSADDGMLVLLGSTGSRGQLRDCITQLRRIRLELRWRGRVLVCLDDSDVQLAASDDLIRLQEGFYRAHTIVGKSYLFAEIVEVFYSLRPFEDNESLDLFLERFAKRDKLRAARKLFAKLQMASSPRVTSEFFFETLTELLKMWTDKNSILTTWLGHGLDAKVLCKNATLPVTQLCLLSQQELKGLMKSLSIMMKSIPEIGEL